MNTYFIIKNRKIILNENDPYGNDYSGPGILPHSKEDIIKQKRKEEFDRYKEIWNKDIENKRLRKIEEKKRKKEMDILEEKRIKREIEEINLKEERERKEQMEKEDKVYKENEKLIKFKIKNKNLESGMNYDNKKNSNNISTFNYDESLETLRNKYKNIDLNNIHFYKKNHIKKEKNKKLNIKHNNINNYRSVNQFEFSPNPKVLDDSKNPQISRLKREINYGYMQISSFMKNLKNNVIEADNNKNKAENQLKVINDEINKEKKYQLILEKDRYEKSKNEDLYNLYNNNDNYANVNDIDPMYHNKMLSKQSNMNGNKEMSNLAKIGRNLIKLSSESEFIPIGLNYYDNNNYNNIGIIEEVLLENKNKNDEIENETIFQKHDD